MTGGKLLVRGLPRFAVVVLAVLASALAVSGIIAAVGAVPDFLAAVDSPARLLVRGEPECSSPHVDQLPALVWTIQSLDPSAGLLHSTVRLIVPQAVVRSINPAATDDGPLGDQFSGAFQIVPNLEISTDPSLVPVIRAGDMFRNSEGLVSAQLALTSEVTGSAKNYPMDVYVLRSAIRLFYVSDGGPTPLQFTISFDCRGAGLAGYEICASTSDGGTCGAKRASALAEPAADRVMVNIEVARDSGGRIAILAVVTVSLMIGLYAFRFARRHATNGQNALLAALTALALIQVRPVIVPNIVGVWTITDRILFFVIVLSAIAFVFPSGPADDGSMSTTDPSSHAEPPTP